MGRYEEKEIRLKSIYNAVNSEKTFIRDNQEKLNTELEEKLKQVIKNHAAVVQLAKERQIGFPWLAEAYDEYFALQQKEIESYLIFKKNPATSASETVKEQMRLRRKAEKDKRIAEYLVKYYEHICPFLLDLKEELHEETENDEEYEQYSDEEKKDEITGYLTIDEYRKLPSAERNQKALDRYLKRPKTKWQIGRMYERYIGFIYEQKGYDVEYVGALQGLEDLGRDLICKKERETAIIQCKMWSHFKAIHEKHIFQFFGTVFQYRDENPHENVNPYFYTTTKLSDLARKFSNQLGISLLENHKYDSTYPCIKCNVSPATKERIYHLPMDQQYDRVKIIAGTDEFYCSTVKDAESAGFRRAFRFKGHNKQ